jgi:bifunctional non-homologous end joining protein LigD
MVDRRGQSRALWGGVRRYALHGRVNDANASACAFDVLMLNGEDLRGKPYVERKAALRKLLRHGRGIQYVEHAEGHGDRLFEAVCKLGLEGIVKEIECALSVWSVENLD